MIDAFKPSYLRYAPYLSSLTKKYEWGELEMPAGHGGGMEIFFKGKTDTLATFYKKENSSLNWIRYFTWLEKLGKLGRIAVDCMINFPRLIKNQELHRTGKIPLRQLYKMEMHDSKRDYKNLPIIYRYFPELDRIGHRYGTESREIINAIRKIDKKISKMKFDIILSDHGMADVNKIISVPKTKDCIIESDMVRYWGTEEELKEIKKLLPAEQGKIIAWLDKNYGDLIFLANKGVLILPNYWQGNRKVKAMHGYDGKSEDMSAFYIIKSKADDKGKEEDKGGADKNEGKRKDLKAEELHKIFEKMLKET